MATVQDRGTIGWAVRQLQAGSRVTRAGWNGKNMWLELRPATPYEGALMEAHVVMHHADLRYHPWLCSQLDLLANDWEIT